MNEISDLEILYLLKENPQQGMTIIIERYMGLVYTIINNKISSVCAREDIEECASDIFLLFFQSLDKIDLEKGSIKAFLCVMARRRAVNAYHKHSKKNYFESTDEMVNISDNFNVENSVLDRETRKELTAAILSLGEPDSEIIVRKYYLGQSAKEIGAAFHIKENTIHKRVSRCIVKLREILGGVNNGCEI